MRFFLCCDLTAASHSSRDFDQQPNSENITKTSQTLTASECFFKDEITGGSTYQNQKKPLQFVTICQFILIYLLFIKLFLIVCCIYFH